ncbi:hypothetical protein [Hymenobacter sp. IS2118]|uniref:hypothetical protein n=1 Tax=Hymenobacter sp. IS2118 TaxID=1505605 RepID=UPI001268F93A|nr:hypothetical protein [Hymenobacter sp. IS2118]
MSRFKKRRGLKRYYKSLLTANDFEKVTWLDLDNVETWRKNWHHHFDWYGYGDNSFKKRKPHLDKLFRHFELFIDRTKNLDQSFQLYAVLLDFDSSSDALFLHTPNQDNNQFPFKVSDLQATTTLKNSRLNDFLNSLNGYEKLYGQAGEAFCLLFRKNIGQPF